MSWNADGQKICIVYEDGAVIVGSVDGKILNPTNCCAITQICLKCYIHSGSVSLGKYN